MLISSCGRLRGALILNNVLNSMQACPQSCLLSASAARLYGYNQQL